MVDVRNPHFFSNGFYVVLKHLNDRTSSLREYDLLKVQAVDMEWVPLELVTDLFTLDHNEFALGPMYRIEPCDRSKIVVVGQNQEVISMLSVPRNHLVGRAVSVTVEGVGMGVAFVPLQFRFKLLGKGNLREQKDQHQVKKPTESVEWLHGGPHVKASERGRSNDG
jgi:hypothetical protein